MSQILGKKNKMITTAAVTAVLFIVIWQKFASTRKNTMGCATTWRIWHTQTTSNNKAHMLFLILLSHDKQISHFFTLNVRSFPWTYRYERGRGHGHGQQP